MGVLFFSLFSVPKNPLTPPQLFTIITAVAAAYGWSADISADEVLRELLALNGGGR